MLNINALITKTFDNRRIISGNSPVVADFSVDINLLSIVRSPIAGDEELEEIEGIGKGIAQKILEIKEKNYIFSLFIALKMKELN